MQSREQVIETFKLKSKKAEVAQSKARAKSRLEGLSDEEKSCLVKLKSIVDSHSMKTVNEMLTLINIAETD